MFVARRVPNMEQEMLIRPEYLCSPPFEVGFVIFSLLCTALHMVVCTLDLFCHCSVCLSVIYGQLY